MARGACSALRGSAAQEFGDLGVGEAGEPGELVGAEPGAGEPAQHVTEAAALVLQGGREPVDALLAVLEVHRRADGAHGVVEEHGQQPVPGVAPPVALRRVCRGPGREHLGDRGRDAVARPGGRRGLVGDRVAVRRRGGSGTFTTG